MARATQTATRRKQAATPEATGKQPKPTAPGKPTDPARERLAPGELQRLVMDVLVQHRDTEFTPHAIGTALNRSVGAVGNALHRFARDAESPVVQTSTTPRRYSIPKAKSGRSRAKR